MPEYTTPEKKKTESVTNALNTQTVLHVKHSALNYPYRHAGAALREVDHSWVKLVFE